MPTFAEDVVLEVSFLIEDRTPDAEQAPITVTFVPEARRQFRRDEMEEIFLVHHAVLRSGRYHFRVQAQGVETIEMPEGVTREERDNLIQGDLSRVLWSIRGQLIESYREFPSDEMIESIARRGIEAAVVVMMDDPLKETVRLPTHDALTQMQVVSGCVTCDFEGSARGSMARPRPGVFKVENVRVRVEEEEGALILALGYLNHKNPFISYFHAHLAQLVSECIPQIVDDQLRVGLAELEVTRRLTERVTSALQTTYQIDPAEISRIADEREEEIRESERVRREREAHPPDDLAAAFFQHLMGGRGIRVMTLDSDGHLVEDALPRPDSAPREDVIDQDFDEP
ncbi:hypothetical protein HY631_04095 [Candidatus Uhrbacteria bacterium]|nr:hypothetical protein [Candidatus Uhrbacteria bacterium]